MSKSISSRAWSVATRRGLLVGSIVAGLLAASPVPGLTLRGQVATEKPGTTVTVRAWALGDALRANPRLLDAPLASVQVTGGEAFTLEVPGGTPPLHIDALAPGHIGARFMMTLPEEASLPAVWLPAGQELRLRVTRDGKPEADARVEGYLSRWGAGDSGYGFWCPYLPGQRTDARGEVTWWVQGSGRFGASAVAKDGRWGRESRALPVKGPVELRLASRRLAVKVQDEKAEPVAGIEVAAGSAPAGTAVTTGENGIATLQVSSEQEGHVVAWGETRAGRVLVRPDTRGPVVLRAEPRGSLDVTVVGPPRVLLVPGWIPDAIWRDRLLWASGGRARVPWLDGGGRLEAWAPGWTVDAVGVQTVDPPPTMTLRAAVRVEGVVQDSEQRPVVGVPVWGYLPRGRGGMSGMRIAAESLDRPILAWGVSDARGRFTLPPLPAGFLRLRATRAGWPAAQHGPVPSDPGSQAQVTLTFSTGTTLALEVQTPDAAPLAAVTVEVFARDAGEGPYVRRPSPGDLRFQEPAGVATSDAEGKASLAALAPGKAWVLLRLPGYVPRVLEAEIPAAGLDLGPQTLQPGIEITGRVVDEAGKGLADATIHAGTMAGIGGFEGGRSDAEGRFTIPDQPRDGELVLLARLKGFTMTAEKVSLPPEGEVVLRMRRARVLTGTVVDAETRAPVKDAVVIAMRILERVSGGGAGMQYSTQGAANGRTDDSGEFRLEGLEPQEHSLTVRAQGYQAFSQQVRLPAEGELQPLTIAIKKGLELRGRVVDTSGQPIPGAQVNASSTDVDISSRVRTGSYGGARSGPDGTFLIQGLAAGKHEVRARTEDGASGRAVAEAGAQDVLLRLERPGTVQGRVRAPEGAEVGSLKVRLYGEGGGSYFNGDATTDGGGAFVLEQVPAGTYHVMVEARAVAARSQEVKVESGRTTTVEVVLESTGTVVGTIRGLSASELETCEIFGGSGAVRPTLDGAFRIEGVREGPGQVRATVREDGRLRVVPVEVKAGETVTVEIDFGRGATVTGTVSRSAGTVAMLLVNARGAGGGGTATTDSAGAFRLEGVPLGEVEVTVHDLTGKLLVTRRVDVQSDLSLELRVSEGEVSGRVLAAGDRSGVPNALVKVRREGEVSFTRAATTDSTGAFEVAELEPGTYRLQASATGFGATEAAVAVADGSVQTTLVLEPEQGVDLVVRSADGSASPSVFVFLFRGELQEAGLRLACDAQGRARLSGVAAGAYTGVFTGQGIATIPLQVPGPTTTVHLREAGTLKVITPAVEGGGAWKVRVTDASSGLPAPIRATMESGVKLGWVETRNGLANPWIAIGTYLVEAMTPGGEVQQRTVTVAPKVTQTLRFP
ncbi:MAG: carboxypeptidase regulatory-like domain-containing protein [Thermoanaerobaculaceae bacterium]|jgi:uncharacterized GH25 family protein|nr:carboxypeptidase regulatory-like domain-containing protein [Thermoanaerobaculaceae bacterium]